MVPSLDNFRISFRGAMILFELLLKPLGLGFSGLPPLFKPEFQLRRMDFVLTGSAKPLQNQDWVVFPYWLRATKITVYKAPAWDPSNANLKFDPKHVKTILSTMFQLSLNDCVCMSALMYGIYVLQHPRNILKLDWCLLKCVLSLCIHSN